jgi:hypothetical protein
MPLLAGLLPVVGVGFLASEQTELALIGLSLSVGGLSLLPSYARKHRQWRPLLLFAFGASLIVAVRLCMEEGSRLEAPAMVIGALLIACAHLVNRRLCRSCAACHPPRPNTATVSDEVHSSLQSGSVKCARKTRHERSKSAA